MESEWRQNVADVGMTLSDWRLCARVVMTSPTSFICLVATFSGSDQGFYAFTPGSLPVFLVAAGPTVDHPHFPWGNFVFPD